MLIPLCLVRSKCINCTNKKCCPQVIMQSNFSVCLCSQTICLILVKSFKQHLRVIQMQNINFGVHYCWFLSYANKRHKRIDQPLKVGFSDSEYLKTCKSIKFDTSFYRILFLYVQLKVAIFASQKSIKTNVMKRLFTIK